MASGGSGARQGDRTKARRSARAAPPDREARGAARADLELARLAKALGHPVRAAILRFLLRHGECVCGALVARLPRAQSTVSQHLKVLKQAGFLQGEVDGPRVCYCVDPATVARLRKLIEELAERRTAEEDMS